MPKTLPLASFAALLLAACVINSDDEAGDSSGNTISSSQTASTSATTTAGTGESTSSDATTASTTVGTGESSASESTADSTSAETVADSSSGTGNGGACGWGMTGEKKTPFGYICDGDGEDPDMMIEIDCPAAVELVEEGDCGGNMGITGAGCCDADGNLWYCADDTGEPRLFTEDC